MLEKDPSNRAGIGEIFTTIKLYTCDNKTIYSLEELLKVKDLKITAETAHCKIEESIAVILEIYSCKKCDTYLTNENEFRMGGFVFEKKRAKLYRFVQNVEHESPTYEVLLKIIIKFYLINF
jgi:hypothetical protein